MYIIAVQSLGNGNGNGDMTDGQVGWGPLVDTSCATVGFESALRDTDRLCDVMVGLSRQDLIPSLGAEIVIEAASCHASRRSRRCPHATHPQDQLVDQMIHCKFTASRNCQTVRRQRRQQYPAASPGSRNERRRRRVSLPATYQILAVYGQAGAGKTGIRDPGAVPGGLGAETMSYLMNHLRSTGIVVSRMDSFASFAASPFFERLTRVTRLGMVSGFPNVRLSIIES